MRKTGKSLEEVLDILANQSGLLGLSGVSGDLRDIDEAACQGNVRARIALEVFAASVRHYLGAYLVELDGADVIVFTGGIGENQPSFRQRVCGGLEELGIVLDAARNALVRGSEARISAPESRVQIWTVPTNEELIVARQAKQLLSEAE
jgi:acetate kinase